MLASTRTADGKERYIPEHVGQAFWTTSDCSGNASLYEVEKASTQPKMLVVRNEDAPVAFFEAGALVTPPLEVYIKPRGMGCVSIDTRPATATATRSAPRSATRLSSR